MSSNNSKPAIVADNLTKTFGDFTAVNQVSFKVMPGEIFGFLGPNGSGKSTTIKMLNGLLLPSSGTGLVAGFDISKSPESVRHHIGYMSQKFSLYLNLTVDENLRFYSDIYELPLTEMKTHIEDTIDRLELNPYRRKLANDLPAGVKQRLALGVSYLHKPDILFLDEPTAGVDPAQRRVFWDWIYDLAATGVAVFVTTHYMDEVEHCERIGLISEGNLTAIGTTRELKIRTSRGLPVMIHPKDNTTSVQIPESIINKYNLKSDLSGYSGLLKTDGELQTLKAELGSLGVNWKVSLDLPSMEDVFTTLMDRSDE